MKVFWAVILAVSVFWIYEVPEATPAPHLLVFAEGSDAPLATLLLGESCRFRLEFINSIYKTPVRETFLCRSDGRITIIEVESSSAGVFEYYGIQTDGTGRAGMDRTFPELRLLSHDYAHHRIISEWGTLHLGKFAVNGRPAIIRVGEPHGCGNPGRQ